MTRRRFLQDCVSRALSVSHLPTPSLWFASAWVTKMRRSIGSKKVIASTTAITSQQFGSIRRLLRFMATRASKRSPRKLFQRKNSNQRPLRNEQLFIELKRRNVSKAVVAHRTPEEMDHYKDDL